MRKLLALFIALTIHASLLAGVYWLTTHKPAKPQVMVMEVMTFDFGMMVSANTSDTVESVKSQAQRARSSIDSSESVVEPKPVAEPKPVVKPKPEKKVVTRKPPPKKRVVKKVVPKSAVSTPSSKASVGAGRQTVNQVNSAGKTKSAAGKAATTQSTNVNAGNYRSGLQAAIARSANRSYPKKARRMRKQGTVTVRFHLGRDGQISDITIVGSSGNASLDGSAVKSLKRLGKYKKPPASFPAFLTVPIRFRLR